MPAPAAQRRGRKATEYDAIAHTTASDIPDFAATDGFGTDLPVLLNVADPTSLTPADFLSIFWPWKYIEEVVVPASNRKLRGSSKQRTTIAELRSFFAYWLGVW